MDIEFLRKYCLKKKEVSESTPFDQDTLVFKVAGKMFCLFSISTFEFVNLKCDPEEAEEMRAAYLGIEPGYHMSKAHWNSVRLNSDVTDEHLLSMVDKSYALIVASFSKKKRLEKGL